jgi:hypothetical protein
MSHAGPIEEVRIIQSDDGKAYAFVTYRHKVDADTAHRDGAGTLKNFGGRVMQFNRRDNRSSSSTLYTGPAVTAEAVSFVHHCVKANLPPELLPTPQSVLVFEHWPITDVSTDNLLQVLTAFQAVAARDPAAAERFLETHEAFAYFVIQGLHVLGVPVRIPRPAPQLR